MIDVGNIYLYADMWWWRGLDDTYSVIHMAISTTNQLFMLWRVIDQCSDQYAYSVGTPWVQNMLLLPVSNYGYDAINDTWYLLMTIWYAWNFVLAYHAPTNSFYQMGHTGSQSLARMFIFLDKVIQS